MLGSEGYGLITIYATFQLVLSLLEAGVSTTVNRCVASLADDVDDFIPQRASILRTFEAFIAAVALTLLLLSPAIGSLARDYWLKGSSISPHEIYWCVVLMVAAIAIRLPSLVYISALLGLQRHTTSNALQIGSALFRTIFAFILLKYYENSIEIYFYVILADSVIYFLSSLVFGWHAIKFPFFSARFDFSIIKNNAGFALFVAINSIITTFSSQIDRIILSFTVKLDTIGNYGAAATLAGGIISLSYPIAIAAFPQFTRLLAQKRTEEARTIFDTLLHITILFLCPLCLGLFFFSGTFVRIYFHNSDAVGEIGVLLSWLSLFALGTSLLPVGTAAAQASGHVKQLSAMNFGFLAILALSLLVANRYGEARAIAVTMAGCQLIFAAIAVKYTSWIAFGSSCALKSSFTFPAFVFIVGAVICTLNPSLQDNLVAAILFILFAYIGGIVLNWSALRPVLHSLRGRPQKS